MATSYLGFGLLNSGGLLADLGVGLLDVALFGLF